MSGNKIFLDTNIILYYLSGDETLSQLLDQKQFYISFITQIELLSYHGLSSKELKVVEELLINCTIIDINSSIKEQTIQLRRITRLKLPDCIIASTAIYMDLPLVSADSDFKKVGDLNFVYYEK